MFPYIPHTEDEIKQMLKDIKVKSIEDLFIDLPKNAILNKPLDLPEGASEYSVYKQLLELSKNNIHNYISFLGAGSYDHIIPATVDTILSRSEFFTAYTPYQAEISQGILQAIFEFQTMICELTSLDVSNASLYDGHTAAYEAGVMAINAAKKRETLLISETIHPFTKMVMRTYFKDLDIKIVEIKSKNGITSFDDLKEKLNEDVAGVLIQTPNFYGFLENLDGFAETIHQNKSFFIISSNPMSLGILKSQGEWGADIAIGDTQPFGLPSYFGGPSVGYVSTTNKLLRKMPGRIVGQTTDKDGKRAFVLTLQAREQHIKRERATSNICSNQALAALATTVYLATVGKKGLVEASKQSTLKAHYLFEEIIKNTNAKPLFDTPFFNEYPVVLPIDAETVVKKMQKENIFAGIPLSKFNKDEQFKNVLLVAVTEKRTKDDMDKFVNSLKNIIG